MKRPQIIGAAVVAAVVVAAVVVAGIAVVVLRSDGSSDDAETYEPQIREELLDEVSANPECPDAPESPAVGEGQVRVNVVRVADGCLAYSSESVDIADVSGRLDDLRAEPDVVAADRAVVRRPDSVVRPRQEGGDEQWALAPEHLDGAAVRELWPATAEVTVAVIDTGIDPDHRDLGGQVVERAPWYHRYEGDYDSHGSHVGGIVAAAADDAGVVGLTPGARLMDVQYYDAQEDHLAGPSDDLGEYVRWAVDHGADVVNMSISGKAPSATEAVAVLYAERQGVVVVGAAGNCGGEDAGKPESWRPPWARDTNPCEKRHELKWPAGFDTVLSVGAHTDDNERADFSSSNSSVDVSAPGEGIMSACLTVEDDDRVTCESSGTSQAAPYVSAVAALLKARHPDATPAAIREAITESARTDDRQPVDTRTDEFGWGIVDPEAAAEYLDEHPGGEQPDAAGVADRTQGLFVDSEAGQVMVLDDGVPHPVRPVDPDASVSSADWSVDHSRLVASAGDTVFTWTGPGSTLVEGTCDDCDVAYIDADDGDDFVAGLVTEGTIERFDPATLESTGTATIALPAPEEGFVLYGDVGDKLLIAHSTTADASSPDTLFLVDPLTGEASGSFKDDGGTGVDEVAVDAHGEQVALFAHVPGSTCGSTEVLYLLSPDDLGEVNRIPMPEPGPGQVLRAETLFFNGGVPHAVLSLAEETSDGCTPAASGGIWRLNDQATELEQVTDAQVEAALPFEGLTGDPDTGTLSASYEMREGAFVPTGAPGSEHLRFAEISSEMWATPTRNEVDMGRLSSTPPIDDGGSGDPGDDEGSGEGETGGSAPQTTEAAVARFEDYLHALGAGDIDTLCVIAAPGAAEAEAEGFGTCPETYGIVMQMISPEQEAALRAATVDPALVDDSTPGEVFVPLEAVVADVTFTDEDLGSYTLRYMDGNWFIVDGS